MAEYLKVNPDYQDRVKELFENDTKPEITLEFEIEEHDFINSGKGSAELKLTIKRLGVDPAIMRRIAIAAYEAEINIAAHSRGGAMRSNIFPDYVHIVFKDMGPGIDDLEQAMTPGFSTAIDLVREMGFGAGLGLPNIERNADIMKLDSEKNKSTQLDVIVFFQ
ncbi:MAG: ATP-binding protein [Candidatus Zophobacter franzmannii]|jgi:anti-sigma regulatory factor (Ser/Thr protein kinase)|nr:ATP-binding protein [Candidatus Zophobacter franzmannii]